MVKLNDDIEDDTEEYDDLNKEQIPEEIPMVVKTTRTTRPARVRYTTTTAAPEPEEIL